MFTIAHLGRRAWSEKPATASLAQENKSDHVDLKQPRQRDRVLLVDPRGGAGNAGVVDEAGERAERGDGVLEQFRHRFRVADVGMECLRASAGFHDRGGSRLGGVLREA